VRYFNCGGNWSTATPCDSGFRLLGKGGGSVDRAPEQVPAQSLHLSPYGSLLARSTSGFRVVGRELRPAAGEKVLLDPRHAVAKLSSVLATPTHAIVASVREGCDCNSLVTLLDHVVSVVDLGKRTASVLHEGSGAVALALDSRLGFYLQTIDTTEHWPTLQDAKFGHGQKLPEGITLTVPRGPHNCCEL
jgi:hypothetical protein